VLKALRTLGGVMRTRWSLHARRGRGARRHGRVRGPDFASMQVIPYEPPKPAPAFTLPDLNGKESISPTCAKGGHAVLLGDLVTGLPGRSCLPSTRWPAS